MKHNNNKDKFRTFESNGQLVLNLNTEIMLPESSPVRYASAQLEELDYTKLYQAYSSLGRKSAADPKVMFKVMVYGYECGIYSMRKLEEACRYRIDFIWLLEDQPVPDYSTFARFRTGRCSDAVEDLFYQYVQKLEQLEETDHEAVFIDGTKLESRAGRYTFCWRGSVEKNLVKIKDTVKKLTGLHTLRGLSKRIEKLSDGVNPVYGKGQRKSQEQRNLETLQELRNRWEKYETQLKIMGKGRNSYAKTDHDATFMRMKEDHMKNGQLKPAYNVQLAVNSEYITGVEVFSNRTDYGTLEPFLKELARNHGRKYEKIVADAGYESLDNYLFLEKQRYESYIKPQNYEKAKTKKYKEEIGRPENMEYDETRDVYLCAAGRILRHKRDTVEKGSKYGTVASTYVSENCKGCRYRSKCSKAADPEEPKQIRVKKQLAKMREKSQTNITTEAGTYLRICRSIQVEGAFGLLKNDFGFRRFLTTGKKNVRTELLFLAFAFDLKKYWMKTINGRNKTHLSKVEKGA